MLPDQNSEKLCAALILTFCLTGFFFFGIQTANAFDRFAQVAPAQVTLVQITSNPGEDFAPSVSVDGTTLVYASDQSGNLDIWLKSLGPGVHPPDRQLTFHSASDTSPSFAPDGKRIAFVSHRSDPKGDIYILDIEKLTVENPESALTRLTTVESPDTDPTWSPDGEFIYFASLNPESKRKAVFKVEIATGEKSAVPGADGLNPSISPDNRFLAYLGTGEKAGIWVMDMQSGTHIRLTSFSPGTFIEATPRWTSDSKSILFVRYQDDTDLDGQLTIDDRPNIWSVQFDGKSAGVFQQLTDSSSYDLLPVSAGKGKVIYTSDSKNNIDIWQILSPELEGGRSSSYEAELKAVASACPEESSSYRCLLRFNNLLLQFSGEEELPRIQYRMARGYQELGHGSSAQSIYAEMIETLQQGSLYKGLAEIEHLLLRVEESQSDGPTAYKNKIKEGLLSLEKISGRYQNHAQVVARALLESGNLNFMLDQPEQALAWYNKVITGFSKIRYVAAQAAYARGKVYSLVGDRERLVDNYVQVVRDYNDVAKWSNKSIDEIFKLFESSPRLEKKVSSLNAVIKKYKEPMRLTAAVQNRIGELYYLSGENLLAKEAYRKTVESYSDMSSARFKALVSLANIYSEEENYDKSLSVFQEVANASETIQANRQIAQKGWVLKAIEKGKWELRVGETKLALKTFLKIIEHSPETVEGHRGHVEASSALKRIDKAIEFYESRLKNSPSSAVDHYAIGLAYTYLSPPDLDAAEKEISLALGLNAQQVFFHQTLGWVYEQKERQASGEGYLERTLHEYQVALALNDEKSDPENEANLLLNLGNGHYLLNNSFTAYHYYRERAQTERPFYDVNRKAIFHQRYAESAFKAGFPLKAVAQFKKALKIAEGKKELQRMAELNDRIALAWQDKGEHEKAVEFFSRTLELHRQTGNQVSFSRTLRNIANNLYDLSQGSVDATQTMNEALGHYFKAIENLEKFGLVKKDKEKTALLDIDIQAGLGSDSTAVAYGFDKEGEQKLIFHYIGKIYGDFGEYDQAVDYFKKKLAFIPENLDPEKNIPILLEKALLLNQIGNYLYLSGKYEKSLDYFRKSYDLSGQLNNRHGIMVNAANIGRAVLTRCRILPIGSLQKEIEDAASLLESIRPAENKTVVASKYPVLIKNFLGILYHYLAFHVPANSMPHADEKLSLINSLNALKQEQGWMEKSIRRFRDALILLEQSNLPKEPYEPTLRHNLELTKYLAGNTTESPEKIYPAGRQWQLLYLQALMVAGENRLKLLMESEQLFSQQPPQWNSNEKALLGMQEDLYQAITGALFKERRFTEALNYSEKGRQQLLVRLRPEPLFSSEDRVAYQEAFLSYSKQASETASQEEEDALLEEYAEFLEMAREDDSQLVALYSATVPMIEEIQSLLRENEVLIKYQTVRDSILIWEVGPDSMRGGLVPLDKRLTETIRRLGRGTGQVATADVEYLSQVLFRLVGEKVNASKSLILLADGELELLPWAALQIDGRRLIESVPVTFISSLEQFRSAESLKNLYNSRFLAVEESISEKAASVFTSTQSMSGANAKVEAFKTRWPSFGVIHVGSPVRMIRHDPRISFINLTRGKSQFERLNLSDLFSQSLSGHFIAITDVTTEFHPDISLSPTALLTAGLSFKGYPGILLRTGSFDSQIEKDFMELFYENFRKMSPAESLRLTQQELAKRHPDNFMWAGYRYYGFPGMSDEEKSDFAEEHFMVNAKQGAGAFAQRNWLVAIDQFEKALVLLDYLDKKDFAEKIYKKLSQAAYNNGDYTKAIHYQKAVFSIMNKKEDPEALAESHYFLGILYSRAEEFDSAVDHLKQALNIYKENEILDQLAESYSTLGIIEENALDYDRALEAFTASMKISEDIGEDINRGRELRRIGRIYYLRLSRYGEARKYFTEANELFAQLEQPEQRAETLLELGLVSEKEGDFPRALEFYKQAQALTEKSELKPGLSKALLYQANSHWFQGNYQQAFRLQKEAWEIAVSTGDQRQQAFIQNTLGLIYWTLNDSKRALTHLQRSLKLAGKVQSVLDVATAYNNIGLVHRKDKRYEESIKFFNLALERDIQLKSKWGQGYTHRNLGMSYMRLGNLDEAEIHIVQAVDLSSDIGNRTNLVKSMLELGNLSLKRGQWKKAAAHFKETRDMAERLNVLEVLWRALRGEGFALVKLEDRIAAVEVYKKAVKVVDRMRASIKVEEFQNGFLTDKQDVYKELVLLLLDTESIEESFEFAERAKSRSFIDLLGNQKINLKNDVSQKLYDRLTAQKKAIRLAEEALGAARARDDETEIARFAENLVGGRNHYQDLLIEAKEQNPEISSFVTVESIKLKELHELLGESIALVEYLVTENELVVWVVKGGKIEVRRIPVKEKELNILIHDYRNRMQNLAPLDDQARKLHELLISPIQLLIENKRAVGIVPHGHLHYISFASLTDGESYLVEKHPLFYSPSASVLKFTFARKYDKSGDTKVLALGNPDLGDFNYDLPLAEMEVNAIKWDFPQTDVLTRDKASESWLQEHISEYQIIHISSHGEFDPVNPLFSALKLTRDEAADGNFEVNEVFSLDIKADLVTLSACQTGLGEITGGDELVGLNRAFIYAGTHSILSSLWRVSDISTAVLIKHFYRNYTESNKAESLRKAQLLVKRLYPHPSYWAGFNLTGDYR